ncbi:MAG: hypothetical protein A3K22_03385 [Deltaproteobacteria bacterium RBG_16_42_7]|nr:MAG: hypothetical protein A3K22_03385 [Deltaproteobacteria bacterium RBG_16_42_7]
MILNRFTKGIVLLGIICFMFIGFANADEKVADISKQEAQKKALEHQTYGNKYDDNGQFKEAIEEYKKSLEYVPNDDATLFNLAVVYLKVNKPTEAAETLEKVVKILKDDAESYNLLGMAYRGCRKEADAKKAWEKSLKINPDQPKVKQMMSEEVSLQSNK